MVALVLFAARQGTFAPKRCPTISPPLRTLRIIIACTALLLAVATASVRLSMPDPPPLAPVASNISAAPDPISLGVRVPTDALEVQLHYLSLDPTSLGTTVRANGDGNKDSHVIEALRRRSQHLLLCKPLTEYLIAA